MKNWIGKSLIGIGIIHTLFCLFLIVPQMGELLDEGLINTINGQPKREAFLWFTYSGFALMIIGAIINWIENQNIKIPKFVGVTLLASTIFMLFFSPASGVWLILIPAIAILLKK